MIRLAPSRRRENLRDTRAGNPRSMPASGMFRQA